MDKNREIFLMRVSTAQGLIHPVRVIESASYIRYEKTEYKKIKIFFESVIGKKNQEYRNLLRSHIESPHHFDSSNDYEYYLDAIYYLAYRDNPEYRPELLKYSEKEILNYIKQADPLEIENYNKQNPDNKI